MLKRLAKNWRRVIKHTFINLLFFGVPLVALSLPIFYIYHSNQKVQQSTVKQSDTQASKDNLLQVPLEQEEVVIKSPQESVSTKQSAQTTKSNDVVSEADQARINELKQAESQLKENDKKLKDSFDNIKETLSGQTITPPPTPKSLPTVEAPAPIKVYLPTTHYTKTCWDDALLGKQCKTTMSVY